MSAVSLQSIYKSYEGGKVRAVEGASFDVKQGELFGLIGPDGAGKTSIFRILTTVMLADKGVASLLGFDVVKDYRQIRSRVGYMPGKFSLYQDLTVHENLEFFAAVFGTTIDANYEMIKEIYEQIKPFKSRRAGKLSGGMKQKLALCCALIHKPEILLLDEPTTGVDAVSRKEFWEMLGGLKEQGITILVSTPYMDEANLCERIALIQNGRIMSVDTPLKIISAYPVKLFAVKADNIYQLLLDLRAQQEIESCFAFGEFLHVTVKPMETDALELLNRLATQFGHTGIKILAIQPTIEDSFIRLMNQNADTNKNS